MADVGRKTVFRGCRERQTDRFRRIQNGTERQRCKLILKRARCSFVVRAFAHVTKAVVYVILSVGCDGSSDRSFMG